MMPLKTALGVGKCDRAKQIWDVTDWDDDYERVLNKKGLEEKCFVKDGSDYYASLLTKPDFGCVQFEPKDQQ